MGSSYPEKYTSQDIDNYSFNDSYKIKEAAGYGYQQSSDTFVPLNMDASGNLMTTATLSGSVNVSSVPDASNNFGQATSVTNGSTATIVNIASSASGFKIRGFSCTGNGDGYFFVTVAGTTILSGRTKISQPTFIIPLPNPIPITTGSAVALKVTNESGSTADFEGTLFGE